MKSIISLLSLIAFSLSLTAQSSVLSGKLLNNTGEAVIYANIVLYSAIDSSLAKVETTDDSGVFNFQNIIPGNYYAVASYVGMQDARVDNISLMDGDNKDLGTIEMTATAFELETATVTARRAMVEVKADRTIFNVQGTINSTGDNGLDLLRKAPGILIDNNDNVTVLSRSGVLFYVDGKRLPLSGEDLSNYLRNLRAEQIDRVDIITNPGAKYEAQGNAGIIDIRLKKNENHGLNGSVSSNTSKGLFWSQNLNFNGNMRNSNLNTYAQIGGGRNRRGMDMFFSDNVANNRIENDFFEENTNDNISYRWGTDFFVAKNQTIGFIIGGGISKREGLSNSDNSIANINTPTMIDSFLLSDSKSDVDRNNQSYNLNYAYDTKERSLNIDADYGRYRNESDNDQPNAYFAPDTVTLLREINTAINTPVEIDIYTFKVDYEMNAGKGKLGFGTKLSKVATDNTFLFYDIPNSDRVRNDLRSNQFFYDENVIAGYLSYAASLNDKWSFTSGLRLENTDATGNLEPFDQSLTEDPVEQNYLSVFPSGGLTWQKSRMEQFSLNYSRRINRPDYNVLNPFRNQLNELSFSKGNPFLLPEIVNNMELGFLWKYRYNFKLSYSRTIDQITRLIGVDEVDDRARFINWDNLAVQTIYGFNMSLPLQLASKWNAFVNFSTSYINNQADYGDGAVIDLGAFTYNIFQQHTITLPKGITGEVSGWFAGPGIWGGTFEYDESWSLNLGLQKKFLQDNLNVRLSAQDIFNQAHWTGRSVFNGLESEGIGFWDSRRVALSLNYNFGNKKVKSRNRKTGIEDEEKRAGSGGSGGQGG